MSRLFRALTLVLLAASCGGGSGKAPRQLDNACSIITERPEYMKAFRATERKYGVPVHVQMATIYQESKFISDARTPYRYAAGVIPLGRQSSAFGYSQALDGTWDEYRVATGKRSARRDRIRDATDFMGWYMVQTQARLGVPGADARNQYLADPEGRNGFRRGSYNSKPWLVRVAGEVDQRSAMYAAQLQSCGGRRG